MSDLATGLALVLVIEGILWALVPGAMRAAAVKVGLVKPASLRIGGLVAAVIGVGLVWLIRR